MKPDKKIAVIGTINRDTVRRVDGSVVEGYGGILYNLLPLAALVPPRYSIYPVVNIGVDHSEAILTMLLQLPRICFDAVTVVDRPNNHCLLTYHDFGAKSETLKGWVGGVSRRQLERITDSEYIHVNFISGADISLSNLRWLREKCRGTMMIDFHSRTLGRRADGSRFLRVPPRWSACLALADIVQMNETEFALLTKTQPNLETVSAFLAAALPRSVRALIVTLGAEGAILSYRRGKNPRAVAIKPRKSGRAVDTTGCGDIFSAAVIAALCDGSKFEEAVCFAVDVATERARRDKINLNTFSRLSTGLPFRSAGKRE